LKVDEPTASGLVFIITSIAGSKSFDAFSRDEPREKPFVALPHLFLLASQQGEVNELTEDGNEISFGDGTVRE
jgi:hypothetical protein